MDTRHQEKPTETRHTETQRELLVRARQLLPDFDYCRRCGKPIWGLLSVQRGIGPTCELAEAVERAERERGTHRYETVVYRNRERLRLVH